MNHSRFIWLLGRCMITFVSVAIIPTVLLTAPRVISVLWPFNLLGGVALSWICYSSALPLWKRILLKADDEQNPEHHIRQDNDFALRCLAPFGSFALHTTIAVVSAAVLAPWVAGRWLEWIVPIAGPGVPQEPTIYYVEHLALANIIPTFFVGYTMSRKFRQLGAWAWVLPTLVISYKLFAFANPEGSVLIHSDIWSRFVYYFSVNSDVRGPDLSRAADQIIFVAPFYSGIAYSLGSLAEKRRLLERLVKSLRSPTMRDAESQEDHPTANGETQEGVHPS